MTDPGGPFAPARKTNRESLEQLPNLILKLTEEVKELKLSNSEFMENIRYKEAAASLKGLSAKLCTMPDISPLVVIWLTTCFAVPWHQLHASALLTGFIDVSQLVSEVEEVEQVRKGMENCGSPGPLNHFDVKVSLILAWASLAVVNLDTVKAQELGSTRINIDAFARDLWRKARSLITHFDSDSLTPGFKASMSALPRSQPFLTGSHADFQQTGSISIGASTLLLRVVAIKILLLLAARSFAAPSEYLKLHLDTVSSAVEASLDSPWDKDVPLEDREWRWQLWSFLCVLDWTSPGIYHNGSYFIRPEMHSDPPSKVPGIPDDGTHSPTMGTEQLERLSQTRYFLKYSLALANLSRRAEDCIIRLGPISPAQAAELCSELDALDNKLSFYQLLGGGARRGGEGSDPSNSVSGSASGGGRDSGSGSSHTSNEHRVSLQEALQVQNVILVSSWALSALNCSATKPST
ncbi:hypothetical protein MMC13_003708 [Lambiella insularis]|nr:hypothetical protein [Lambiella insularis]